jgi:hypothetical protein
VARHRYRRNADALTEKQEALYDEIMEDDFTPEQFTSLISAVERFNFTSTALYALAEQYLEEYEDTEGNLLLLQFAEQFAKHEAKTL